MWQRRLLVCVVLCAGAVSSNVKASERQTALTPSVPAPWDSGRACSCSGVFSRTLDCSNRGRSAFNRNELCWGRTTRIDLSRNSFTTFPTQFGAHISEVNVSRNQLTSLPRTPPLNANTGVLDVSHNNIAQSSNELQTLSSLKILSVDNNRLQSLAFLPQSCNLRHLSARHNFIGTFHGRLKSCVELKTLDLSYNKFPSLPRGVFARLDKMKVLRMSNCEVSTLAAGSLKNLKKLEYLDLSQNRLTALPSAIFASLKDLENIDLSMNELEVLPSTIFLGIRELKTLNVHHNSLRTLPGSLFSGITSMEVINFGNNQLANLPPGLFQEMKSVKILNLSHNQFTYFTGQDLAGLKSLEHLDITFNGLTSLPAYDATWPAVTKAFFGFNIIVDVSESVVRSWVGSGKRKRLVSLGPQAHRRLVTMSLKWMLTDRQLTTSVSEDCQCGGLKSDKAQVQVCVSVSCPPISGSWVEEARASLPGRVLFKG